MPSNIRFVRRRRGEVYVSIAPNGASSAYLRHEETGTEVRVVSERTYGSGGDLHSLTYDQRPDLAVEISRIGTPTRVLLFDPKYKLDGEIEGGMTGTRPLKTDIDKMHTYRDAIRDAEGNRTVEYAAILYPGEGVRFPADPDVPPQVEALRADPGNSEFLSDRLSRLFGLFLRE